MIPDDAAPDVRAAVERMEAALEETFAGPDRPADAVAAVQGAAERLGLTFVSGIERDGVVEFTYALPTPSIVRTFRVPG